MNEDIKKKILEIIRFEYGDEWQSISIKLSKYPGEFDEDCPEDQISEFKLDLDELPAEALLGAYIAAMKMKQNASKKQHKKCGNFYMDTTIDSSKTKGNKINEPIY